MIVIEAARQLGIGRQTHYCWHKEYGGLDSTQARKMLYQVIESGL